MALVAVETESPSNLIMVIEVINNRHIIQPKIRLPKGRPLPLQVEKTLMQLVSLTVQFIVVLQTDGT
jgi:hypothetical protein